MAFISKLAHCFNCSFSLSLLLGKMASCLGWGGGLGTWLGFKYKPLWQSREKAQIIWTGAVIYYSYFAVTMDVRHPTRKEM